MREVTVGILNPGEMRTLYEGAYFSITNIKNEDMNVLSYIFILRKCVLYTEVRTKIVRTYARGYCTAKLVLIADLKGARQYTS